MSFPAKAGQVVTLYLGVLRVKIHNAGGIYVCRRHPYDFNTKNSRGNLHEGHEEEEHKGKYLWYLKNQRITSKPFLTNNPQLDYHVILFLL